MLVLIKLSANKPVYKVLTVSKEEYRILRRRFSCYELTGQPPTPAEVNNWRKSNTAKALCGCTIPYGKGERCYTHNRMSWLTVIQT